MISVLSGHIGGANELTEDIAEKLGGTAVITTAADVNKTIAVDLLGKEFGWKIEDGLVLYGTLASYGHLYFDSSNCAKRFVSKSVKFSRR